MSEHYQTAILIPASLDDVVEALNSAAGSLEHGFECPIAIDELATEESSSVRLSATGKDASGDKSGWTTLLDELGANRTMLLHITNTSLGDSIVLSVCGRPVYEDTLLRTDDASAARPTRCAEWLPDGEVRKVAVPEPTPTESSTVRVEEHDDDIAF